jgi:hypothetical protein
MEMETSREKCVLLRNVAADGVVDIRWRDERLKNISSKEKSCDQK